MNNMQSTTHLFKALDFALVFIACSISYWVRFDDYKMPLEYLLPATILAISSIFCLSITGFYRDNNSHLNQQAVGAALSGMIFAAGITATCLYLTKTGENYSRIWLVTSVVSSCIVFFVARYILNRFVRASMGARSILLLGSNATAKKIADQSQKNNHHSPIFTIASHVQPTQLNNEFDKGETLQTVTGVIEKFRQAEQVSSVISEVWITHDVFSVIEPSELETILLSNSSVQIVYVPEFPSGVDVTHTQHEQALGVHTINSDFSRRKILRQLLKFFEDQLIAWTTVIMLLPVFIAIGVAIKIDSKGPVFFRQKRYGYGGKSFRIWKFRTMASNAQQQAFRQATKNDVRVTSVGRFLRRTSLDELPQVLNVIAGDMSIVGPRPHPEALNEQHRENIDRYMRRHAVKPGITGLAQIRGFRGETMDEQAMQNRIDADLEYVNDWSLWLDLKIIIATFAHLTTTDQAY